MDNIVENVIIGPATIMIGEVDAEPETGAIYTDGGVALSCEYGVTEVPVDQETVPVDAEAQSVNARLIVNLSEASLANIIKTAMGAALDGDTITLGDGVQDWVSVAVEGRGPEGDALNCVRRVVFGKCAAVGSLGMPFKKDGAMLLPAEFKLYMPADAANGELADFWEDTLDSLGGMTWTEAKGAYRLDGFGAAADTLSSIGGSLSGGEFCELRIKASARPITVAHNEAEIALAGDVDFVMDQIADRLVLAWSAENDCWEEQSRHDYNPTP